MAKGLLLPREECRSIRKFNQLLKLYQSGRYGRVFGEEYRKGINISTKIEKLLRAQ